MKRQHFTTAAALIGLGLFCGCASTTNTACGEQRQGLFSRWFGNRNHGECGCGCECIETGRVTAGEGPFLPEPGCGAPGCGSPGFVPPGVPTTTPIYPTMPPPTALPNPNPLAQPVPAGPASQTKDAGK